MSDTSPTSNRVLDDEELQNVINMGFVMICGFLCFLLQAGFGLLEVGGVRQKNAKNIMLKNTMDAAVSAIAYWACGYAFAYGKSYNGFIGNSYYFLMDEDGADFESYVNWFFQWIFAGTTATIVSGAVAERCRFRAYLIYSFFLSGFVYPVVCHWIWDPNGFLYGKVMDFSGSGAVHLVGGAAAMAGAWILGPRIGRFVQNEQTGEWEAVEIPGHNAVLAALGTLVLWFGFLPFNAGAGYAIASTESLDATGRAVVVTTLAGSAGACFLLFYGVVRNGSWDPAFAMNGLLGGMVATCSGVNVYDSWAALLIGILGAIGFYIQAWLFENKLRIDDPLNAAPLHMGCGIVGMLGVGFLANDKYVDSKDEAGIFFGGNGKQLGYQIYGVVVYFCWSFGTCVGLFYVLKVMGWLRVSEEVERMGMDLHEHTGAAYPSSSIRFNSATPVAENVEMDVVVKQENERPEEAEETDRNGDSSRNLLRHRRRSSTAIDPGGI